MPPFTQSLVLYLPLAQPRDAPHQKAHRRLRGRLTQALRRRRCGSLRGWQQAGGQPQQRRHLLLLLLLPPPLRRGMRARGRAPRRGRSPGWRSRGACSRGGTEPRGPAAVGGKVRGPRCGSGHSRRIPLWPVAPPTSETEGAGRQQTAATPRLFCLVQARKPYSPQQVCARTPGVESARREGGAIRAWSHEARQQKGQGCASQPTRLPRRGGCTRPFHHRTQRTASHCSGEGTSGWADQQQSLSARSFPLIS